MPRGSGMRAAFYLIVISSILVSGGCSSFCHNCACPHEKGPSTLLAWEVGPKENKDEDKKDDEKSGDKKDTPNGEGKSANGQEEKYGEKQENGHAAPNLSNGNGKQNGNGSSEPEEPKELAADRPDFTEASTTVGLGRVQLETGYTYSRNKEAGVTSAHSFPEALLRIGMFAEWFELRLGQNHAIVHGGNPDGSRFSTSGFEDLYVGTKLALVEQKSYLPETAVILFATVPTGHHAIRAHRVLPGASLQYGWVVVEDCLTLAGSTVGNGAEDEAGHGYLELAQSLSVGYTLTERLGAYTEFYGFFPHGANAPGVGAQYYFNGGFTYKFTPDFQYDVRAGVGLNRQSDDYFLGTGFVVRY